MEPRWVDAAISRVLRGGVVLSIAVVMAGVVLTFIHHPSYLASKTALAQLTAPEQPFPRTVGAVVRGSENARGQSIVTFGLLLLILTPVARVALSIAIFAIEHDHLYTVITITVFILLLASFALGTAG